MTPAVFYILIFHYLFDWILQPRCIAENKSKSLVALTTHVCIYTYGLIFVHFLLDVSPAWIFINSAAHFVVDFFTSKWSSKAFQRGNLSLFWKIIGLDQLIHYLILYGTLSI